LSHRHTRHHYHNRRNPNHSAHKSSKVLNKSVPPKPKL